MHHIIVVDYAAHCMAFLAAADSHSTLVCLKIDNGPLYDRAGWDDANVEMFTPGFRPIVVTSYDVVLLV